MTAPIGHNNPPASIDMLAVGAPLPASHGRCADLYHDVRELRLLMEKEVERIAAREREVREHLIASLSKGADTGAAGLRYRAQVVSKPEVRVSEERGGWGAVWAWARKNDRLDIFQKRLNSTVAKEFEDTAGRPVPGTETINVPSLSVTKI